MTWNFIYVAVFFMSGTGLLSFLAAKHGAKKVFAIEGSEKLVNISKELAYQNNLHKQVLTQFSVNF